MFAGGARVFFSSALSIVLIAVGLSGVVFLAVWYFELVLWGIFGPFALGSVYLGVRMWRPSSATQRAALYWAISVAWTVSFMLIAFKDVTVTGALMTIAVAASAISLVDSERQEVRRERVTGNVASARHA